MVSEFRRGLEISNDGFVFFLLPLRRADYCVVFLLFVSRSSCSVSLCPRAFYLSVRGEARWFVLSGFRIYVDRSWLSFFNSMLTGLCFPH